MNYPILLGSIVLVLRRIIENTKYNIIIAMQNMIERGLTTTFHQQTLCILYPEKSACNKSADKLAMPYVSFCTYMYVQAINLRLRVSSRLGRESDSRIEPTNSPTLVLLRVVEGIKGNMITPHLFHANPITTSQIARVQQSAEEYFMTYYCHNNVQHCSNCSVSLLVI